MPNDVYSQVLRFQSELDEDEFDTFLYDEDSSEEEPSLYEQSLEDEVYSWESED